MMTRRGKVILLTGAGIVFLIVGILMMMPVPPSNGCGYPPMGSCVFYLSQSVPNSSSSPWGLVGLVSSIIGIVSISVGIIEGRRMGSRVKSSAMLADFITRTGQPS
jgi:hypothetical protein